MVTSSSNGYKIEFCTDGKWRYKNGDLVGAENPPCKNCGLYPTTKGYDYCIALLIKALNDGGIETIASCCGHGGRGNIALRDGREFIIAKDFNKARLIERNLRCE